MTIVVPELAGRRLFVTGATGFVGSSFVRLAVRSGAAVTVLARRGANHWRLAEVQGRYHTVEGALADLGRLDVPTGPGAVLIHAAAGGINQRSRDAEGLVDANVVGTLAALTWAERHACARFVQLGTSGEYGSGVRHVEDDPARPTSMYGATRASATLIAQAYGREVGLDVVVVRPFAVFGPYEAAWRLLPHVIMSALRREPARISSGEQTRDYVYVEDVAAGVAAAAVLEAARGGTFNLCSGRETSVRSAALLAARAVDAEATLDVGAVADIPGEMHRTSGDPARAQAVLGWRPAHNLAAGVQATVKWFSGAGQFLEEYRPRAS